MIEPVAIGPTWQRDPESGKFILPERTLGWSVLGWTATWLQHPDGTSWRYTKEQGRFLLWWYAVDENDRFLYRDGVYQRLKGAGKSPVAATIAAIEFLGPCRPSGRESTEADKAVTGIPVGQPLGTQHPAPWVQCVSVARESNRTIMSLFPSLFSKKLMQQYGIELGKEKIYAEHGRCRIETVTSSARSLEGTRPSMVLCDEALALDTPIPTPTGWTSIGAIVPGDQLLGCDGHPTTVLSATEVQHGRDCYRVTFADGTSIVASDGHLWQTRESNYSQSEPKVRTTAELFRSGRRYRVPAPEPVKLPEVDLPIDPYLLGLWLGNGYRGQSYICGEPSDLDVEVAELRRRGIFVGPAKSVGPQNANRVHVGTVLHQCPRGHEGPWVLSDRKNGVIARKCTSCKGSTEPKTNISLKTKLNRLGILYDKAIPEIYFRASLDQRLDLLRGLMDTDGSITERGTALFCSVDEALARGLVELIRSLGIKGRAISRPDNRKASYRDVWRVAFTPHDGLVPFLLPRKAARVTSRTSNTEWVSISSIEPVPSVPVRCIEVDSSDHLFLAGEGWTVTHNTQHWVSSNGGHEMQAVIDRNLAKSADGSARSLATTNAYQPGEDSVGERARDAWLAMQSGKSLATGLLYDSLEAPADAPLTAEAAPEVIRAVRGDSVWLDVDRIVQSILDPRTPPSTSRRFYYNQITATEDAWVAPAEWDACADPLHHIDDGARITLGFDGSFSDDDSALMAFTVEADHLFTLGVWQPDRVTGEVDRGAIDLAVRRAFDRYEVVAFYSDLHPWESYVDAWAEAFGEKLLVKAAPRHAVAWDLRGRQQQATVGMERLHAAIVSSAAEAVTAQSEGRDAHRSFTHDGNRAVAQHVYNARRAPNRYGVSVRKDHRESAKKIDSVPAAMLARMARQDFLALPEAKRRSKVRTGRAAY